MPQKTIMLITFIGVFLFICAVVAFLWVILLSFKRRQADYKRESLQSRLEIQEHTLRQIALEIHDNVGHDLTLAKLKIKSAIQLCENDTIAVNLVDASTIITKALDDLRDLSRSLSLDIIHNEGLVNAMERQIGLLKNTPGYQVYFNVTGTYKYLDEENEVILFRILQEGLSNIVRHAKAKLVTVTLSSKDQSVTLTIVDDGTGFFMQGSVDGTAPKKHLGGLNNMKARAALLKADFEIQSKQGEGTTIRITVPFSRKRAN